MKRPLLGDQLSIMYRGAIVRARCDDVSETPGRGPGAANFTIVSSTPFVRGQEAELVEGESHMAVQIMRVTAVGHQRPSRNVVLFAGTFEKE